MKNLYNLEKVRKAFNDGDNIFEHLKREDLDLDKRDKVLISYDFQAGLYIKNVKKDPTYVNMYTKTIADIISKLGKFNSIMEAGVGEATTLTHLIPKLNSPQINSLGFDISWSRIKNGQRYLQSKGLEKTELFVGDMFNIPLPDNSIDIIYTSHSIESNGGKEQEILKELHRVCSKYIVLLEPSFNFGNDENKVRMLKYGYITNLKPTADLLGYSVFEYRLFEHSRNPLNPTELIIIEKESKQVNNQAYFRCPITFEKLHRNDDVFYSDNGLFVYPQISGVPCLLPENAILATKYPEFL